MTPNENLCMKTAQNETIALKNIQRHQTLELDFMNSMLGFMRENNIFVRKIPKEGKTQPQTHEAIMPVKALIQGLLYGANLLKKEVLPISISSFFSAFSSSSSYKSTSFFFAFSSSTFLGSLFPLTLFFLFLFSVTELFLLLKTNSSSIALPLIMTYLFGFFNKSLLVP